jgi:hypothetical protein
LAKGRNSYISHWTKIKLNISNKSTLKAALKRMGFETIEGNHRVSQYGQNRDVDLRIDNAVGFALESDGNYSMVGDFYHAHTSKLKNFYGHNDKFQQELTAAYAVEDASEKLANLGFTITDNLEAKVGPDGLIRMVATSWD